MNLAGTSLVAAIPAGLLGYLIFMAMLNSMDTMPMILKVAAIILFLIALTMVLFPVYVMIYHGGGKAKEEKGLGEESDTSAIPSATPEEDDVDVSFADDLDDEDHDGFDGDEDGFGDVEASDDDEDGFDFEDDGNEEFEFDDDDDENF